MKILELIGELEVHECTAAGAEGDVIVFIRGVNVGKAILESFRRDLAHDLPPEVRLRIEIIAAERAV